MKKLLAVGLICFLSGCGFEPLYVQKKNESPWFFNDQYDTSISRELAQVKVEPIENRFGQQIRNQLLDLLTPKGTPKKPKYRLFAHLESQTTTQQALRRDITATSERVIYRVAYHLDEGTETIVSGNSVAYVSYDILANPYSTTMAQKKTETDAARIVANDIALRLGAYFHAKFSKKGSLNDFQNGSDR